MHHAIHASVFLVELAWAIHKVLVQAGATASDVTGLVVNTCTGYICPASRRTSLKRTGGFLSIRTQHLACSGCGGAIPNLQMVELLLAQNGDGVVVSASVEICSATLQMDNDISHPRPMLFGDGAGSGRARTGPRGSRWSPRQADTVPEQRDTIRYVHKNGRLYNQLSLKLPQIVNKAAASGRCGCFSPLVSCRARRQTLGGAHGRREDHQCRSGRKSGISMSGCRRRERSLPNTGNTSSPTHGFFAVLNQSGADRASPLANGA